MTDTKRDGHTRPTDRMTDPDAAIDVAPGAHGAMPLAPRPAVAPAETEAEAQADLEGEPAVDRVDPGEPPAMRSAVLGRLEGVGLIVVVRDGDGNLVAADGTWRAADGSLPLDELRRSFPEGMVTTFAGGLVESPGDGPAADARLEVVITGHGDYEQSDGQRLRLVRFTPRRLG